MTSPSLTSASTERLTGYGQGDLTVGGDDRAVIGGCYALRSSVNLYRQSAGCTQNLNRTIFRHLPLLGVYTRSWMGHAKRKRQQCCEGESGVGSGYANCS